MNVPRRIITNIKPNIIEDLGNGKYQLHNIGACIRYKKSNGSYNHVMSVGISNWLSNTTAPSNTNLVYTKTQTIQADNLNTMEIGLMRCVAICDKDTNLFVPETYYDNNLLSFDYSIDFTKA